MNTKEYAKKYKKIVEEYSSRVCDNPMRDSINAAKTYARFKSLELELLVNNK